MYAAWRSLLLLLLLLLVSHAMHATAGQSFLAPSVPTFDRKDEGVTDISTPFPDPMSISSENQGNAAASSTGGDLLSAASSADGSDNRLPIEPLPAAGVDTPPAVPTAEDRNSNMKAHVPLSLSPIVDDDSTFADLVRPLLRISSQDASSSSTNDTNTWPAAVSSAHRTTPHSATSLRTVLTSALLIALM